MFLVRFGDSGGYESRGIKMDVDSGVMPIFDK